MLSNQKKRPVLVAAVAAAMGQQLSLQVSRAGTSQNSAGPTDQGSVPAITISLSGQTALRTFTASQGLTTLQPGGSITLDYTPYGGSLVTYYASLDPDGYVQLAKKDFTTADSGLGATSVGSAPSVQQHSAIRLEWHEQGSVQGQVDLINDQVGYVSGDGGVTGFLSNLASRGPSTANPTWINSTSFTGPATLNGLSLAGQNFANTYDTTVYDRATGRNISSGSFGGINGQDRIQFSVGEYKTEGLSRSGTPSYSAAPGTAGYGLGNPARPAAANTIGLGIAGGRQQFYSESIANQSTDKVDPQSATNQHYAAGPWNTAGAQNIDSKQVAVTAVTYSANPGTGIYHINKGDAQWLLTTGRLRNGADFNVVMRANDAGQRIVPAVNVGVDPSWAVGENDDGNTSGTPATNVQKTLGEGIRFSGKTSGTESRNAIAQSRMGFGPLSLAEARGAASNAPTRALDVDFNNLVDSGNPSDFKRATFDTIANFEYKAVLVSHYNTIKAARPDLLNNFLATHPGATDAQVQTWWNGLTSEQTGIKGDPYGNVRAFINNVAGSIGSAGAGITPASANNPADALFGAGFLIPGLLNYSREYDGGPLTPNNLTPAQLAVQQDVKNNYGPNFTPDGSAGANSSTIGSNAYYGALNAATVLLNGNTVSSALNGGTSSLLITNNNYLFGNFNQDGRRDYASVKQSLNAVLSLHQIDGAANNIYTAAGGVSNATVVTSLNGSPGWATTAKTKGDLIILGDYNSDGAFDGKDVYQLAHGASLSDNATTDHLTAASGATFGDQVRNPNAKLNKNAALDFINSALNNPSDPNQAFVRQTARANAVNDPAGANAFNKFDVNRDGLINRDDAKVVDRNVGKNYTNLNDVLGTADDLVNAELQDNRTITDVTSGAGSDGTGTSDFKLIRDALTSTTLLDGDANFDGTVDVDDLFSLATHWLTNVDRWSLGDFDYNGIVNSHDLGLLAVNWQGTAASLGEALAEAGIPASAVPEPATFGLLGAGILLLFRRRRRAV